MDKPISVGDLVVVVKPVPCCQNPTPLGLHAKVVEVRETWGRYHCSHCNATWPTQMAAVLDDRYVYQLFRLKRIPPLEELEGEKRDEKLTEPA